MKHWKELSKVELISIEDKQLPAVSLGTSPFVGAGQFGDRSMGYYEKFLKNPQNMVKMIIKAVNMGVPSVQLLAYEPVVEAFLQAEKEINTQIASTMTIGFSDDLAGELDLAEETEAVIVFIHGNISVKKNYNQMAKMVEKIRERHLIPGCAIHAPEETLRFCEEEGLSIAAYLTPINLKGKFMGKEPGRSVKIIENTQKVVIAKKTLAAGEIAPKEGLEYIRSLRNVKGIAVGLASEVEAEETLSLAISLWKRNNG